MQQHGGRSLNERNQAATLWVGGGLDETVDEELLWELFSQAGPVVDVSMPKDKVTGQHQHYAFVELRTEHDADYAMKVLNAAKLNGKSMRINHSSREKEDDSDVGANLFVGNLDKEVDDQILYNTFSAFGQVLNAKSMLDVDGAERGFGFVHFASFESSDAALEAMNGQYLCNRPIYVSYAYKKEGSHGERHGSAAERQLSASRTALAASSTSRVHTQFASAAGAVTMRMAPPPRMMQAPPPQFGMGAGNMPPPLPNFGAAPPSFAPPQPPYGYSSQTMVHGHGIPPPLPPGPTGPPPLLQQHVAPIHRTPQYSMNLPPGLPVLMNSRGPPPLPPQPPTQHQQPQPPQGPPGLSGPPPPPPPMFTQQQQQQPSGPSPPASTGAASSGTQLQPPPPLGPPGLPPPPPKFQQQPPPPPPATLF